MIVHVLAAWAAQSPTPSPQQFVTPPPGVPPDSNAGTMALWLGVAVVAVLSAVAYMVLRRRRIAAEEQRLDDAGA